MLPDPIVSRVTSTPSKTLNLVRLAKGFRIGLKFSRRSCLPSTERIGVRQLPAVCSTSKAVEEGNRNTVSGLAKELVAEAEPLFALKAALLEAVRPLDFGLAASSQDAEEVEARAAALEAAAWQAGCSETEEEAALVQLLPGTWRLMYSSGFNSGSLGGRRPGPPAALFPLKLGKVLQRINAQKAQLDNVVELVGRNATPGEAPAVRLSLAHDYETLPPRRVKITFTETSVELPRISFLPSPLPLLQLPEALRPPRPLRSATFDITFLDASMRITRGDRGELRVFVREEGA